ncbi:hypothetical protein BU23DRAFT_248506 [Bimuria novae-zelandiae CBS 107.79]|uniref:Uncharacterized protein n=1 Tax=Bimuria novae-zelandiae CBS 107.79 TaxID=1447943 RepID=A0A6A5UXB7_9PLEO|nr:hypothetical protein BU23DRAFT_248506 [Bimuria novae-zelandiae CBS 107.79]
MTSQTPFAASNPAALRPTDMKSEYICMLCSEGSAVMLDRILSRNDGTKHAETIKVECTNSTCSSDQFIFAPMHTYTRGYFPHGAKGYILQPSPKPNRP